MRKKSHMIGAVIFGILGYYLWYFLHRAFIISPDPSLESTLTSILSMDVLLFLVMIAFSIIGGLLPDILDPPFTKHHRSFAHSKTLFTILVIIWVLTLYMLLVERSTVIWMLYFFLMGYISHLVLD